MHYHLEIILPPQTDDIPAAVESVMRPFDENLDPDNEESYAKHAFWDFYSIGGRYAGRKFMATLDKAKLEEFEQWCQDEEITVSGFQCGKQELSPADQIPKVDAKWNELFPQADHSIMPCPLFRHSNDPYGRDGHGMLTGDVSKLSESQTATCARVIFAGNSYNHETGDYTGPLKAVFMLAQQEWNGVNHMEVKWDGTIQNAFNQWIAQMKGYKDSYRSLVQPNDEWLCVTVDYHS